MVIIEVENGIKASAIEKAKSDLALGYQYIEHKYPGEWRIKDGSLYKGETKINDNYELVDEIGQLTNGDTVTIFMGDTRVTTNVMKEGKRAVGTQVSETVAQKVLKQGETYLGEANVVGQIYQSAYQPIKSGSGEIIGIWYVGASQEMIEATQKSMLNVIVPLLIGIVILTIIAVLWFTRRISRRLSLIGQALEHAGQGDFTVEIKAETNDEIGHLTKSYEQMRKNLVNLLRHLSMTTEQVAASSEQLSASSQQNSRAAEQIAVTVQQLAQGANTQVENTEDSSQAIQELSANVGHIVENTHSVSTLAENATSNAADGNESIQKAVLQMNAIHATISGLAEVIQNLGTRSKEIGQIIETITGIAGQTNLLALNAAIEAARAGENGRGFAVVADEVRKLAEESSQSAQQINELISAIQEETYLATQAMEQGMTEVAAGIDVVGQAGDSFRTIEQSVSEVALRVQEVSAAIGLITRGTGEVVEAINDISAIAETTASGAQHVSAATDEQLASMEEIHASATTLAKMADDLQQVMSRFKV
ncbi:methyl-accepting chemotaxis protein [Brevibacillus migulae]|uniref:methyl-accepting chemotaxis protein n=1 Tax=Brevibacillus migulae TaxID=1644114 RepID=UPI001430A033|nr:methyl-accepting chemotaxis protein [Brevibacillus migulae]